MDLNPQEFNDSLNKRRTSPAKALLQGLLVGVIIMSLLLLCLTGCNGQKPPLNPANGLANAYRQGPVSLDTGSYWSQEIAEHQTLRQLMTECEDMYGVVYWHPVEEVQQGCASDGELLVRIIENEHGMYEAWPVPTGLEGGADE